MFDAILLVLSVVIFIHIILRNKKTLKALRPIQLMLVILSYILAVGIGFVCIYFGGNWFARDISNTFLKYAVFLIIVLVTISLCKLLLAKLLSRITNGVLPQAWK